MDGYRPSKPEGKLFHPPCDCFDTAFVLVVILVVDGLPRITLYEELFSILESDIDILFAKICHDTYGAVDPPASAIVFVNITCAPTFSVSVSSVTSEAIFAFPVQMAL